MAKKGSAYHCPPKKFSVPPDISALGNHAKILTQSMRTTYAHRMAEANKRK